MVFNRLGDRAKNDADLFEFGFVGGGYRDAVENRVDRDLWRAFDRDLVDANALLERGMAYHPDDWRNRFHLGYNRFFYLHDNAGAADVLEPAIRMQGAPNYLGAFVARLRAEGGDLETSALFLETLIENEFGGKIVRPLVMGLTLGRRRKG